MEKLLRSLLTIISFFGLIASAQAAINYTDSVTVSIRLVPHKATSLVYLNNNQQFVSIDFQNTTDSSMEFSSKLAIPQNRLLSYRTYYKGTFYTENLFLDEEISLRFDVDSLLRLRQINASTENQFLDSLFNIYSDFALSKPYIKFSEPELESHYRASDSIYLANQQIASNLLSGGAINEERFKDFSRYLRFDYFSRLLAPITYNFPYDARLNKYINPLVPKIEKGLADDGNLFSDKARIIRYLMKYYMFKDGKEERDFVAYKDMLLGKDYGDVLISVLLGSLEKYPTKQDSVFNLTLSQINQATENKYHSYLLEFSRKFDGKALKANEVFLLSNQAGRKTNWSSVMQDSKDQLIVVDFWASWCVPCIQEFPHLKLREKSFEKSGVKFLTISVDDDDKIASWTNMLNKHDLGPANQFKLIDPRKSQLVSFYRIVDLPRYLVLGKNGELLNDNFLKPSNPDFEKELRLLMEKNSIE